MANSIDYDKLISEMPREEVPECFRFTLEEIKNNRNNPSELLGDFDFLRELTTHHGVFLDNRLRSESLLSILVALKRHPDHEDMKNKASLALCALLVQQQQKSSNEIDPIESKAAAELISIMYREAHNRNFAGGIMCSISSLCRSRDGNVGTLVHTGYTQAVISIMKINKSDASLQFAGCDSLYFAMKHGLDQDILVDLVGVALSASKDFANLVNYSDFVEGTIIEAGVSIRSFWLLGGVMEKYPDCVPEVVKGGGPTQALSMMTQNPHDADLSGICIDMLTLTFFASNQTFQKECFHAVLSALKFHTESTVVQSEAASFFCELVKEKPGALLLLHSEAIPYFFSLMRLYPDQKEFQTLVCESVIKLSQWKETREAVITEEAASLVTCLMKTCSMKEVKRTKYRRSRCLTAVGSLLVRGKDNKAILNTIVEDGGAKAAIEIMAMCWGEMALEEDPRGSFVPCFTLIQMLASHGHNVKLEIVSAGGIGFVLRTMKEHPNDEMVQENGCKTLGILTTSKHPLILESISKTDDGVDIILDAIFKFKKNMVIFNYGGSAAILTREFEYGMLS